MPTQTSQAIYVRNPTLQEIIRIKDIMELSTDSSKKAEQIVQLFIQNYKASNSDKIDYFATTTSEGLKIEDILCPSNPRPLFIYFCSISITVSLSLLALFNNRSVIKIISDTDSQGRTALAIVLQSEYPQNKFIQLIQEKLYRSGKYLMECDMGYLDIFKSKIKPEDSHAPETLITYIKLKLHNKFFSEGRIFEKLDEIANAYSLEFKRVLSTQHNVMIQDFLIQLDNMLSSYQKKTSTAEQLAQDLLTKIKKLSEELALQIKSCQTYFVFSQKNVFILTGLDSYDKVLERLRSYISDSLSITIKNYNSIIVKLPKDLLSIIHLNEIKLSLLSPRAAQTSNPNPDRNEIIISGLLNKIDRHLRYLSFNLMAILTKYNEVTRLTEEGIKLLPIDQRSNESLTGLHTDVKVAVESLLSLQAAESTTSVQAQPTYDRGYTKRHRQG